MKLTDPQIALLDELYADILGTNYSNLWKILEPFVADEPSLIKQVDWIKEVIASLTDEGLIVDLDGNPDYAENQQYGEIVITKLGRQIYESYLWG